MEHGGQFEENLLQQMQPSPDEGVTVLDMGEVEIELGLADLLQPS